MPNPFRQPKPIRRGVYDDPRLRPPPMMPSMPDMPGPEKAPRMQKSPMQPAPMRRPGNLPTGYMRFLRQLQAQAETPGGR